MEVTKDASSCPPSRLEPEPRLRLLSSLMSSTSGGGSGVEVRSGVVGTETGDRTSGSVSPEVRFSRQQRRFLPNQNSIIIKI